jgi:hypothetical protein
MDSGVPMPLPLIPRARCLARRASHRVGSSASLGLVAVGVGNIWGLGPGEHEHALAAVWRADVGGADATPCRVIPRVGQVAEYTVESATFPAESGDVLHDDERGS